LGEPVAAALDAFARFDVAQSFFARRLCVAAVARAAARPFILFL
jgi:hypothetical protein